MDRCFLPTHFDSAMKFGFCYPGATRSRPFLSIFTPTLELTSRLRICCWDWSLRLKKRTRRSCLLNFKTRYGKCSGGLDYWIALERIDFSQQWMTACKIISGDTRQLVALAFRHASSNFVSEKVPRFHSPRHRSLSMAFPIPH